MGFLKGILFLFFAAFAIGFAVQNDGPVSLKYYFGWETILLPIFLWAFLSFFLGLILSGILTEKEELVRDGFAPFPLSLVEITREAEWSCLTYRREN